MGIAYNRRTSPKEGLDYFPTPPWATRALLTHVLPGISGSCLEPACGEGHMSKVLQEYGLQVVSSDIHSYGYGEVSDFLKYDGPSYDWIITNPPYILAEEFIEKSLEYSLEGCAFLVRSAFIESIGRWERLYSKNPPTLMAQFAERVGMIKGAVAAKTSTTTPFCWLIWKHHDSGCQLSWIPPCRRQLERKEDYQ